MSQARTGHGSGFAHYAMINLYGAVIDPAYGLLVDRTRCGGIRIGYGPSSQNAGESHRSDPRESSLL